MLIEAVKQRLAGVDGFANVVEEAAQWEAVLDTPSKLQGKLKGFVIPLGGDGQPPRDGVTGVHSQLRRRVIAVCFALREAGDQSGRRLSVAAETLTEAVIAHLAGFQPEGFDDVLAYVRDRLIDVQAGVLFHHIEFAIPTHVRTHHG